LGPLEGRVHSHILDEPTERIGFSDLQEIVEEVHHCYNQPSGSHLGNPFALQEVALEGHDHGEGDSSSVEARHDIAVGVVEDSKEED
jgi:hypothetical protein